MSKQKEEYELPLVAELSKVLVVPNAGVNLPISTAHFISPSSRLGAQQADGRSLQPNTQFGLSEKFPLVAAAYLNAVRYASHVLLSIEPPRAATPGGFLLILGYSGER